MVICDRMAEEEARWGKQLGRELDLPKEKKTEKKPYKTKKTQKKKKKKNKKKKKKKKKKLTNSFTTKPLIYSKNSSCNPLFSYHTPVFNS